MKRILCFFTAVLAALIAASCGKKTDSDTLTVSFIDVGKGDCILVECGGNALMIDTGYADTAGKVYRYLSDKGIEKLDALIITHYDKDHAGGAAKLAGELQIGTLYLPDYEGQNSSFKELMKTIREKDINTEIVGKNKSLALNNINITVFASHIEYDPSANEGNDNDVSLVISAVHGSDSYLFTGDIEKDGIKSFLNKNSRTFDVLKMPHHGRKESNTEDLVESVDPKYAVITDSSDDPADKKVLSLLDGKEIFRSSACGNIVFESSGDGRYKIVTQK